MNESEHLSELNPSNEQFTIKAVKQLKSHIKSAGELYKKFRRNAISEK